MMAISYGNRFIVTQRAYLTAEPESVENLRRITHLPGLADAVVSLPQEPVLVSARTYNPAMRFRLSLLMIVACVVAGVSAQKPGTKIDEQYTALLRQYLQ